MKAVKSMVQVQEPANLQESPHPNAICVHHWIIGIPEGPVSQGRCKKCGEGREFNNYVENPGQWSGDVSLDQVTSGAYFQESASQTTDDGWNE